MSAAVSEATAETSGNSQSMAAHTESLSYNAQVMVNGGVLSQIPGLHLEGDDAINNFCDLLQASVNQKSEGGDWPSAVVIAKCIVDCWPEP